MHPLKWWLNPCVWGSLQSTSLCLCYFNSLWEEKQHIYGSSEVWSLLWTKNWNELLLHLCLQWLRKRVGCLVFRNLSILGIFSWYERVVKFNLQNIIRISIYRNHCNIRKNIVVLISSAQNIKLPLLCSTVPMKISLKFYPLPETKSNEIPAISTASITVYFLLSIPLSQKFRQIQFRWINASVGLFQFTFLTLTSLSPPMNRDSVGKNLFFLDSRILKAKFFLLLDHLFSVCYTSLSPSPQECKILRSWQPFLLLVKFYFL